MMGTGISTKVPPILSSLGWSIISRRRRNLGLLSLFDMARQIGITENYLLDGLIMTFLREGFEKWSTPRDCCWSAATRWT